MPRGSMDRPAALGVDFGTTNTVVAVLAIVALGAGWLASRKQHEADGFPSGLFPVQGFRPVRIP